MGMLMRPSDDMHRDLRSGRPASRWASTSGEGVARQERLRGLAASSHALAPFMREVHSALRIYCLGLSLRAKMAWWTLVASSSHKCTGEACSRPRGSRPGSILLAAPPFRLAPKNARLTRHSSAPPPPAFDPDAPKNAPGTPYPPLIYPYRFTTPRGHSGLWWGAGGLRPNKND